MQFMKPCTSGVEMAAHLRYATLTSILTPSKSKAMSVTLISCYYHDDVCINFKATVKLLGAKGCASLFWFLARAIPACWVHACMSYR